MIYCTLRYDREQLHIDYALDSSGLTVRREKNDGTRTFIAPNLWPVMTAYGIDRVLDQDWFAEGREDPAYVFSEGVIRQHLSEEDDRIAARYVYYPFSGSSDQLTVARFLTLEELMGLEGSRDTKKGRNIVVCRNIARAFSLMLRLFDVPYTKRAEREQQDRALLKNLKRCAELVDLNPLFLKYADVL